MHPEESRTRSGDNPTPASSVAGSMPLSRVREVMELAWRDPGTGVSRATNVVATFAEAMDPATLSNSTFKLYKGTTQITNVTVTPSADGTSRTLGSWSLYILCFEHA